MDNLPVNSKKPIIQEMEMEEKVLDIVIYLSQMEMDI